MDYETMNQKMFELSESEKRYLHGDSWWMEKRSIANAW